jgi:hypothetical protein
MHLERRDEQRNLRGVSCGCMWQLCGGVRGREAWRVACVSAGRREESREIQILPPRGRTSSEGFLANGFQLTSPPTAKSTQSGYIGAKSTGVCFPRRLTAAPTRATHSSPRHASHAPPPRSHAPPPRSHMHLHHCRRVPPCTLPHAQRCVPSRTPPVSCCGVPSHTTCPKASAR